jgi:hypothetical protein
MRQLTDNAFLVMRITNINNTYCWDTGSPSRHDTGVDLNKTKKVCKNV